MQPAVPPRASIGDSEGNSAVSRDSFADAEDMPADISSPERIAAEASAEDGERSSEEGDPAKEPPLDTDIGKIIAMSVLHAQRKLNSNGGGEDGGQAVLQRRRTGTGGGAPPRVGGGVPGG